MTLDDNAIFIDTNILIYANVAAAPYHQLAIETLQDLNTSGLELWLSRQILREFIATLTRPQTFATIQPQSVIAARVQFFEQHFRMAEDNAQVTARLLDLFQTIPMGGQQIHDANIVATMLTVGVNRLLTHNVADFERFSNLSRSQILLRSPLAPLNKGGTELKLALSPPY